MKKEKVKAFVRNLMEKLHIKSRESNDVMRCMENEKVEALVRNLMEKLEREGNGETDDDFPKSAREVYFPWKDVIESMMKYPGYVRYVETTCPDCGERLLQLEFSSPDWTWEALCGSAGTMLICPNCPRQDSYRRSMIS